MNLEQLVQDAISELNYTDCFLVEIVEGANKFEIFIDSDEGVTFLKCRKISRLLEEHIDANPNIPEKYTLDVSSAGVGRPLKLFRQYKNNVGRLLAVKLADGSKKEGDLLEATEEHIKLEVLKDPNSKKKIKEKEQIIVEMNNIMESKVKVRF